jgi:putative ABC transport system substrate-binding protein
MRRRDFVKGIVGSAVACPLSARAQQPAMPVVGFLSARSREDFADLLAAVRAGLADTGFAEDRNIRIESPPGRMITTTACRHLPENSLPSEWL